jgi:phytoene synthase
MVNQKLRRDCEVASLTEQSAKRTAPDVNTARALDPALTVALAWQPLRTRPALAALFNLDRRLSAAIAQANEPMLAQLRLAWWRDRLAEPVRERPRGEPLLAAIGAHWGEHGRELTPLIDGWESWLIGDDDGDLGEGRAKALAAFARLVGRAAESELAAAVGHHWTRAETGKGSSAADVPRLRSRALRGLVVLDGLARRSLARGEPMMHGRGGALAAIRLGMFGA